MRCFATTSELEVETIITVFFFVLLCDINKIHFHLFLNFSSFLHLFHLSRPAGLRTRSCAGRRARPSNSPPQAGGPPPSRSARAREAQQRGPAKESVASRIDFDGEQQLVREREYADFLLSSASFFAPNLLLGGRTARGQGLRVLFVAQSKQSQRAFEQSFFFFFFQTLNHLNFFPTTTRKKKPKKIRTHAVAGCVAGLASTLALQPLDVVKTRLQVQDGVARSLGAATAYRGTAHALASIARAEGWLALYAGLAPALLGAGLSWGAYFAAYSAAKERWVGRLGGGGGSGGGSSPPSSFPFWSSPSPSSSSSSPSSSSSSQQPFSLPAAAHMAAAAEAGALVALLTNPVWVVKTRLQLQARGGLATPAPAAAAAAAATTTATATAASPSPAAAAAATRTASSAASAAAPAAAATARAAVPPRPPRPPLRRYGGGVRGTIRAIVAEEGVAGLYRGLLPSLLLVSHGAIQFAVYEELKALARANSLWLVEGGGSGGTGGGSDSATAAAAAAPRQLASLAVAAAGAASKVAACVATYPAQVLRARLQQKQLPASVAAAAAAAAASASASAVAHPPPVAAPAAAVVRYDRLVSAFKTILAREGVGGFYKGLSPTLLRVVPQSALTFMAYERVLGLLQAAVEAAARAKAAKEGS